MPLFICFISTDHVFPVRIASSFNMTFLVMRFLFLNVLLVFSLAEQLCFPFLFCLMHLTKRLISVLTVRLALLGLRVLSSTAVTSNFYVLILIMDDPVFSGTVVF